jgi:hypothetical protein
MDFVYTSHRFAEQIIQQTPELALLYGEVLASISEISDELLLETFLEGKESTKSLSIAINALLKDLLHTKKGWEKEAEIFQGEEYANVWRLDFLKKTIISGDVDDADSVRVRKSGMAIEVAFNHGEAIPWNLLKPVLAAEINHIEKSEKVDIGSGIGIVITASKELKDFGGFDGAVGEYEKVLRYLKPMNNQLTVPMIIIGLLPPKKFMIARDSKTKRSTGEVIYL